MRKNTIVKLSMGVTFAAALTLASTQAALADSTNMSDLISMTEPAVSLVMPFDQTTNKISYEIVTRRGGSAPVVATHWAFWSDSCDHLGDVFICMTDNDTVVVSPTAVQTQVQRDGVNVGQGSVLDFTGSRGFITVSQFEADLTSDTCRPINSDDPLLYVDDGPTLVGSWVISNTTSNATFGNNAIGFTSSNDAAPELPSGNAFFTNTAGLDVQFFVPYTLTDSLVIVLGIASPGGNGEFSGVELGPIPANLPDGNAMCCNAEYFDDIETDISLPDLCFTCASFSAIQEFLAKDDPATTDVDESTHFLIPDSKAPKSPDDKQGGFVRLSGCYAQGGDGVLVNLNVDSGDAGDSINNANGSFEQFIFPFSFHGMAVGPFGTAVSGKYTQADS